MVVVVAGQPWVEGQPEVAGQPEFAKWKVTNSGCTSLVSPTLKDLASHFFLYCLDCKLNVCFLLIKHDLRDCLVHLDGLFQSWSGMVNLLLVHAAPGLYPQTQQKVFRQVVTRGDSSRARSLLIMLWPLPCTCPVFEVIYSCIKCFFTFYLCRIFIEMTRLRKNSSKWSVNRRPVYSQGLLHQRCRIKQEVQNI